MPDKLVSFALLAIPAVVSLLTLGLLIRSLVTGAVPVRHVAPRRDRQPFQYWFGIVLAAGVCAMSLRWFAGWYSAFFSGG